MNAVQLLAWCLAATIPALALHFAAPAERTDSGLAVALFGWPSLVGVHILAAIPLAYWIARKTRGWFVEPGAKFIAIPIVVGLGVAALAYFQVGELGESLGTSFAVRVFTRGIVSVLLAWPWCWLSRIQVNSRNWPVLISAVVAFALPAIHADSLATKTLREGSELLQQNRLAAARPQWIAACDLAPARNAPDFKKPTAPPQVLALLDKDIAELNRKLERGPPSKPESRLAYATALLSLDRLDEAEVIFASLPQEAGVVMKRAEIDRRRGRFSDSDDRLRPLLQNPNPEFKRDVYEQLARNASDRHDSAEIERLLNEAITELPAFAGYFTFRLGELFHQTGRPLAALEVFDRTEKLDPKLLPRIEPHRRKIREQTPGCLIR